MLFNLLKKSKKARFSEICINRFSFRDDNGDFEMLEVTPYSAPPDLPEVMKTQESNGQEQSS